MRFVGIRDWSREFFAAGMDRARDGLRFRPLVKTALDAGEAAGLGLIDEAFARIESLFAPNPEGDSSMWWQAFIPLLLDALRDWLNRRNPQPQPVGSTKAQGNALADQIDQCLPVSSGGTVASDPKERHAKDLADALRNDDEAAIEKCLVALIKK